MTYTCNKCLKVLDESQFYTHKDGSKTDLCKKCLTMHIDNFDPSTFLWILEKIDVPYVAAEWNILRDRAFAKNPNLNGTSVFGKYLSKMKLKQWKEYGWEDSERLQVLGEEKSKALKANQEKNEQILKQQLEDGVISEAQYKTMVDTETQYKEMLAAPPSQPQGYGMYNENEFIDESQLNAAIEELTDEDKLYLAMKWGRLYKPEEWIALEKTYTEMTSSFDIQDADTIRTLIVICKTDLKMNQSIDCGDIEGFQKLSKVSESLRKSAKFTAAQNKEEKGDFVDSVGELVAICERDGFIPRFVTDIPQDKIDVTLKDMNQYVHKLVTQDLGFGQQIENALKKIEIQREMAEAEKEAMENGEIVEIDDEDLEEHYQNILEQKLEDLEGEDE